MGAHITNMTYHKDITGLLVIDPYNDFSSAGDKVWDRLNGIAEANHCRSSYAANPRCRAKTGHSRFLCAASSISRGRLRVLEVHLRPFSRQHGRERPRV